MSFSSDHQQQNISITVKFHLPLLIPLSDHPVTLPYVKPVRYDLQKATYLYIFKSRLPVSLSFMM